jgi:hypothetical protein
MGKKITSLAMATIFSLSMAGVSLAAKCKGKIESIDESKIVITLDGKCDLKCGDSVDVKKARRVIEGC